MNARKTIVTLQALFLALAATGVAAQEGTGFSFSGYVTLGYAVDNADGLGVVRDFSQRVGGESKGSWKIDSRLGLQFAYRATQELEFVTQVVARNYADPSLARSIEWAYVNLRPVAEFDVRLGRVGVDVFMLSDYRNVGYAYPWVRPPKEAYGWMPIFSMDGIDAAYSIRSDDAVWRVKGQAGRSGVHAPMLNGNVYDFETRGFWDATLSREAGPWRVKAGHARFEAGTEAPLGDLRGALATVAALPVPGIREDATAMAQGLMFKGAKVRYSSLGVAFDDGAWVAQAELSQLSADKQIFPQGTAGYVSVGRRFNELTPYVMIAAFNPANASAEPVANWSVLGRGPAMLQAGAVRALNSPRIDQRTTSLGVRWDFHRQMALKLQWDRTTIGRNGYGLWSVVESNPLSGERVDVLTVTLDFVF